MWNIDTVGLLKIISKLKKHPLKKKIIEDIDSLQWYPYKGKYLQKIDIYELKYPNLRIHYVVKQGLVVIAEIEYEGIIKLLGKGNKNQQKRQLNK